MNIACLCMDSALLLFPSIIYSFFKYRYFKFLDAFILNLLLFVSAFFSFMLGCFAVVLSCNWSPSGNLMVSNGLSVESREFYKWIITSFAKNVLSLLSNINISFYNSFFFLSSYIDHSFCNDVKWWQWWQASLSYSWPWGECLNYLSPMYEADYLLSVDIIVILVKCFFQLHYDFLKWRNESYILSNVLQTSLEMAVCFPLVS